MTKVKNIIIFVAITIALTLIYVFFIRNTGDQTVPASLVSSSSNGVLPTTNTTNPNSQITKDFLSLLLNVKSIKLEDTLFSDLAFNALHDSSILITPDGTEGRPNPFAPIGSENMALPIRAKTTGN